MTRRASLPLRHRPFVWDAAIALLACIGIGGVMLGLWLSAIAVSLSFFLALLLLFFGSFIEPKRIHLNTKVVRISDLPDLTIAVTADFHIGPFKRRIFLRRIVSRLNALRPDLIVLPGDFLFDSDTRVDDLEALNALRAPLGVFAVLGNHDSGQHMWNGKHLQTADRSADVQRLLEQCGITVLRNQARALTHKGQSFAIAGIDDLWMPSSDLQQALASVPDAMPLLLLSHNPDVVLHPAHVRAALIISGHTHGGQFRLPIIGSLAPIPSATGCTFDQGICSLASGTMLAVTHGIGETMCRARLFCPPEILVLRNTTD